MLITLKMLNFVIVASELKLERCIIRASHKNKQIELISIFIQIQSVL